MPRVRIAILSRYNGLVNRGIESWAINLCRQLEGLGHTCLLIQGGADVPRDAPFRTVSLPVKRRKEFPFIHRGIVATVIGHCYLDAANREAAIFSARALPHLIAFHPDVIIPASYLWTVVAAKIAGWVLRGKPRIAITSHAGWSYLERDALRLGINGFAAVQPLIYDWATEFERGRTAVELIPYGVEIERFASGPTAPLNLAHPVVIVVSALEDYKRVDMAVRAVARAGMSLLLLGDGPNSDLVTRLARALLDPRRFLHLPKVAHADVAAYYRAADVFSLPSTSGEAFGIVILEAMAAGLPVVVNDDPVRRWIAGSQGLFIDPSDTEAYADALVQAVTRPRASAPDAHLSRFGWPAIAEAYARFFARLGAEERCSRAALAPLRLPFSIAIRLGELFVNVARRALRPS